MNKRTKQLIIAAVCMLICVSASAWLSQKQSNEQADLAQAKASRSLTPFQKQAVTFGEAYDLQVGHPESKDEALKVLKNAQILCAYLDEDPDLKYAFTYGTDKLDMSSDQTVAVIQAGIHAFCPQHKDLLKAGE